MKAVSSQILPVRREGDKKSQVENQNLPSFRLPGDYYFFFNNPFVMAFLGEGEEVLL